MCANRKFIFSLLKEDLPSLEGYLFPETYHITKYTDERTLIQQMVKRFLQVYSEVIKKGKTSNPIIPLKRHQIVTLASIIEKETGASQERPLISSVFYNRLEKKMLLQTDPTVLYGILDETKEMKKNITRKDLETPTRYNTYTNKGLPYGPIANPGRESLLAALQPAQSHYLFFVSRNDGTHYFSEKYQDHQQKVQQYQVHSRGRP